MLIIEKFCSLRIPLVFSGCQFEVVVPQNENEERKKRRLALTNPWNSEV